MDRGGSEGVQDAVLYARGDTWGGCGEEPSADPQACEDYRAAATIDLDHDRASLAAGDKLKPEALLVLWGARGVINRYSDPVAIWRDHCDAGVKVSGGATQSGHYIAEEVPGELLGELEKFFGVNLQ